MNVTRQARRAQERKTQKEHKKLIKQLQLSDLMY
jgi:hypothetical protein